MRFPNPYTFVRFPRCTWYKITNRTKESATGTPVERLSSSQAVCHQLVCKFHSMILFLFKCVLSLHENLLSKYLNRNKGSVPQTDRSAWAYWVCWTELWDGLGFIPHPVYLHLCKIGKLTCIILSHKSDSNQQRRQRHSSTNQFLNQWHL